jgi:histidinol phosphatase-like PHP family hydrolase
MSGAPERDINREIAGNLFDLAMIHSSEHGRIAYRRAARAFMRLEQQADEFVKTRSLREIPYVGPASERIALEVIAQGRSPWVEAAVEKSDKRDAVRAGRAFRATFLSRAGALAVLRADIPGVITVADYRGDLQVHSEWSDGGETIAELVAAARARGHDYIGISDHSYGLRIAGGMSMDDAARQHREIEALNRTLGGAFRVIKAIEANIPLEGGVDMQPAELAQFEVVLAAPHSRLRRAEDQTDRMLAMVRHPAVHVLAHPRGRMYSRQGVLARWDEVFAEAQRHQVAIELDGDSYRQDLDHTVARRALHAGCLFALDSDAHSGRELAYEEYALAHARLAGIPAARVINTWPAARLLEWAKEKSAPGRRAA